MLAVAPRNDEQGNEQADVEDELEKRCEPAGLERLGRGGWIRCD